MRTVLLLHAALLRCAAEAHVAADVAAVARAPPRRRLLGNSTAPRSSGRSALDAQQLEHGAAILLLGVLMCAVPTIVIVLAVMYAYATKRLRACLVHNGLLAFQQTDASAARDPAFWAHSNGEVPTAPSVAGTAGDGAHDAPGRRAAMPPVYPTRASKPQLDAALLALANSAHRNAHGSSAARDERAVAVDLSIAPPLLPGPGVTAAARSRGAEPASATQPAALTQHSRTDDFDTLLSRFNSQNTFNPLSALTQTTHLGPRGKAASVNLGEGPRAVAESGGAARAAQRPVSVAYRVRGDSAVALDAMLQLRGRTSSM